MSTAQTSWVHTANDPACDFPLQNLPFGVFSTQADPAPRVGVAVGDLIVDLAGIGRDLPDPSGCFRRPSLNALIAQGPAYWRSLRETLAAMLAEGSALAGDAAAQARVLVRQADATMHLPVAIGDYTDFYASRHHAQNVGALFRDPARALNPNWLEIPVGYHGRASSVVVSPTPVRRPMGQIKRPDAARPVLAPCERLDFELELGTIIGVPNGLGEPVSVADAEAHIFGVVLLNDWSARDIQLWEAQPLGPFNAKNFATSISPWVVTLDALAPFRTAQPAQDPVPLEYLRPSGNQGYDITLEVAVQPAGAAAPVTVTRTNFAHMYWTMAQQVAHHTVGGCNLNIGDLLGSGTVSGPEPGSEGCLLEQSLNGARPVPGLAHGFLQDGDTVTMHGYAQGDGYRVGFGSCAGRVERPCRRLLQHAPTGTKSFLLLSFKKEGLACLSLRRRQRRQMQEPRLRRHLLRRRGRRRGRSPLTAGRAPGPRRRRRGARKRRCGR